MITTVKAMIHQYQHFQQVSPVHSRAPIQETYRGKAHWAETHMTNSLTPRVVVPNLPKQTDRDEAPRLLINLGTAPPCKPVAEESDQRFRSDEPSGGRTSDRPTIRSQMTVPIIS